jgi:quinol monooxygenase YgiN
VKRMLIQYKVKPDRAAENQQYIERVFEELRANSTAGIRYVAFKGSDGLSFAHLVSIETDSGENPLQQSPAFQAFQAGIRDRCAEPPVATDLEEVGSYRVFGA